MEESNFVVVPLAGVMRTEFAVAGLADSAMVAKRCLPPPSCRTPADSRSARAASMRLLPVRWGSPMLAESSSAKMTDFSTAGTGTFSSREGWSNNNKMITNAATR